LLSGNVEFLYGCEQHDSWARGDFGSPECNPTPAHLPACVLGSGFRQPLFGRSRQREAVNEKRILAYWFDSADHSDHIHPMSGKEIGTLEAKTRLSQLLAEVQRGESFFITRHGKRIAELGPVRDARRRPKPGFAKGTFTYVAPDFDAPLDDFREYEQ
jgi:prevent-host-death family protein